MSSDLVKTFEGQCRPQVDSTTQVSLQRHRGRYINLIVGGALISRLIPSSGPTVSNGGLSASTVYFIYAYDNAGALALELSTTGHVTDATFGIEVKSGDNTRALVGMLRTNGSTQFVDSASQRFMASWFNRRPVVAQAASGGGPTTTSVTYVEIASTFRAEFVTWAADVPVGGGGGDISNSVAGGFVFGTSGLDGVSTLADGAGGGQSVGAGSRFFWHTHGVFYAVAEGYHYVTLAWRVNTGTGTYNGGSPELAVSRAHLFM